MASTPWRKNPLIYEINAWTWLAALTQEHGHPITLGSVPDADIDALAGWGFDAIWLMGVWERSPAGRNVALNHPGLQEEFRRALPDFRPEDVVGSPYAVRNYAVDAHLGGPAALATFRQQLAARGLRLVLDFVPNHVAVDHPWLVSHPECFVQGTKDESDDKPDQFFDKVDAGHTRVYAYGRDPYFPTWTDTAQVNAFSPALRAQAVDTLLSIASQGDAVRCDMAMLVTNQVFAKTWGARAGAIPPSEYWEVVISAVKARYPDFKFLAEVYWDMERALQQQGFDYTYDKRLYDCLRNDPAREVVTYLEVDFAYQDHMVRFIENHDEARATVALGAGRDLAAAVLVVTLPGATLLHEGQLVGHQIKLPVQLDRRPPEPDNAQVEAFYRMLLDEARHPAYHAGEWRLRECNPAWDLNASNRSLIAYTWRLGDERRLVVVNYSATSAQGRVPLPDFGLAKQKWKLHDVMHRVDYERDGDEISDSGLYVDLLPWQTHVFQFAPLAPAAAQSPATG
jgi:hypothetical protein